MANPVLAELVRAGLVESRHRGALAVTDPDGTVRSAFGDVHTAMYPRSSTKPLQALGMLRAGLDIDEADLALACASHSGQATHVSRVLELLARHGLGEDDLACPADYPQHAPSRDCAVRSDTGRRRATMNCSGKHAAMLATCVQRGWPTRDYTDPKHPLQETIAETVVEMTREPVATTAVDGCGAPLFAFSQLGLTRAFSRLGTADDAAVRRVAAAMRAHPWLLGGSGQTDTLLMLSVPGLLAKRGAEAVHALALPDGTGITVKIDDGSYRALGPVVVAALRGMQVDGSSEAARSVLNGLGTAEAGGGRVLVQPFVARDLGPVAL